MHEVSQKETLPSLDPEKQVKQLCEAALAADLEAHRMLLEVRKLYCSGQATRADVLEVRKGLDEARELLSKSRIALHLAPGKDTGAFVSGQGRSVRRSKEEGESVELLERRVPRR